MSPFLQAATFIVCFILILAAFITFIVRLGRRLNHKVNPRVYNTIEGIVVAGIVLGVAGMFQPFTKALYEPGFLVLLSSTLGFIVWS
ncbi:MAG: hypothetical protein HC853_19400, partial [Anaerolineae bacterium]|nr:hypothetical protein [Anaerolineae bacterium]